MEWNLVFQWWAVVFAIGLAFLPLTFITFRRFYDKGYVLSRAIGIVVISYVLWLLSSLRIVSFVGTNIWIFGLIFLILNAGLVWWKWDYFKGIDYKSLIKPAVITEVLFLFGLCFWAWVRGHRPEIEGIEKFMNQGFIMSILRADYMPAVDMWWAGSGINYYYFGHFMTAVLIRFAGIVPEISYNLMVATLFGMMVAFPYCITSNIAKRHFKAGWKVVVSGLIASSVMAFGANLHPFFEGVIGNWTRGLSAFEGYWFPNATRYVGTEGSFLPQLVQNDSAIHEFPSYAALIADLHAHFTGLIMAFVMAGLVIAFVFRMLDDEGEYTWWRPQWEMWLFGLMLAGSYMANTWDFPIYLMLFGAGLWLVNIKKLGCNWGALGKAFIVGVALGIYAIILVTPFNLNFENIADGVTSGLFRGLITMPDKFFILWGHYLFMTIAFIWAMFAIMPKVKKGRKRGRLKALLEKVNVADAACLVLLVCAVILIYLPEVVYVRDIYVGHPRANTMFKLTYQAFILFTFALGYAFFRIWEVTANLRKKRWMAWVMVFVVALPLLYTIPGGGNAIRAFYGGEQQGLDGYNFFMRDNEQVDGRRVDLSGDLEIVRWLNENVSGSPVVLEAYGPSFTVFGRISMATGLPTIVGWEKHQWLWRGDFGEVVERQREVREIYEGGTRARELLREYDVEFIVIGDLERVRFDGLDEGFLMGLGDVKEFGSSRLIKVEN